MTSITQREARARKHLAAKHCQLQKAPSRHWTRKEYGVGYQIVTFHGNVEGAQVREYGMTLDQVEEYVSHLARCDLENELREALRTYIRDGGDADELSHIYRETIQFAARSNEGAVA